MSEVSSRSRVPAIISGLAIIASRMVVRCGARSWRESVARAASGSASKAKARATERSGKA